MTEYIQLIPGMGHEENKLPNMHKDDFYTLITKDFKVGIRNKQRKDGSIIFFANDIDIEYLKSDLVRFCLALYKSNRNIHYGELSLIPKQPIPISKELQDYIEEFLPDYYGIRDNVKI
jgi:hypothetical protein